MKKKFVTSLIALITVCSLASCSTDNVSSTSSSSTPTSESSTTSTSTGGDETSSDSTLAGLTSFSISNKETLQKEYHLGDANRQMDFTSNLALNYTTLLGEGTLVLTSSDTSVVTIVGLYIHAAGVGTATITAKLGDITDTVEITVLAELTAKDLYGTVHTGLEDDPLDNEDAITVAKAVGTTGTDKEYYIQGTVKDFVDLPGNSYGNVSFYLTPAEEGGESFEIYRAAKDGDTTEEKKVNAGDIWPGATATILAKITAYNGGVLTIYESTAGGVLTSIEGTAVEPTTDTTVKTVAEAITAAQALSNNACSYDYITVAGYIVYKDGNNLFLQDEKPTTALSAADPATMFEIYGYSGTNASEMTLNAKIQAVVRLKHYVSTSKENTYAYETAEVKEDITVLEAGDEAEITIESPTAITTPEVGVDYYGFIYQGNKNANYFLTGEISSKNFLLTGTYDISATVQFETNGTGYNLKFTSGTNAAKYIVLNSNNKVELSDTASTVWAWNSTLNTVQTTVDSTNYYLDAYSNHTDLGASKASYVVNDDGTLKSGQFPLQFVGVATAVTPTEIQVTQKLTVAEQGTGTVEILRANPYNADLSTVTWTSSDETIATVDSTGVVTGVAVGTATITATIGTVSDTCTVTVKAINRGTEDAPLTTTDAVTPITAFAGSTTEVIYVTGKIKDVPSYDSNHGSYTFTITDGTTDVKLYSGVLDTDVTTVAQNDTVTIAGHPLVFGTTYELAYVSSATDDFKRPKVLSRTAGTSTITVTATDATVTGITDQQTATNDTSLSFTVTPTTTGWNVTVTVNGVTVEADTSGNYTFTVAGDTEVIVTATDPNAVRESYTITADALGNAGMGSYNGSTEKTATIDDLSLGYIECMKGSNGVQMRYKNSVSSRIYNTAATERAIASITVTFNATKQTSAPTHLQVKTGSAELPDALTDTVATVTDTSSGSYVFTYTPTTTTDTFFQVGHDQTSGTIYIDSILVTLVAAE